MRPAAGVAAALVLMLALLSAGCDWREFDDLKKRTPVAAISAPSNYPAESDFGSIVLPVAPPGDGSASGRFVVSAMQATSVAVVSIDAAGNPSGVGVTGTAFDQLMGDPIVALAEVPGKRQVLLGVPARSTPSTPGTFGDVLLMDLSKATATMPSYPTSTFAPTVGEPQYGVGVAAGNLGGGADPEIVVVSEDSLHVYVDSQPTADRAHKPAAGDPCVLVFSPNLPDRDRISRAVVVAPLLGGSATQIAVGTPVTSGGGHVSIFDVDTSVTTGGFTCAATLTAADTRFGRAMAIADLLGSDGLPGGDGVPDHLVVGAPPAHVYLYKLPLSTGQAPAATATDPDMMATGNFGASIAALDIDGLPGDEIFIGNSDAAIGGQANAGRVSIYTGPALALVPTSKAPNPLTEHDPAAGHGYGATVAGMTFCPGGGGADAGAGSTSCTRLPIVGALSTVFTYFTLKKPDPRAK